MRGHTHKKSLVRLMLDKGDVTACQINISNANQYFDELEIIGVSNSRWGMLGKSKVKWRFIPTDKIEKAKKYIGIKSTDNAQGLC